MSVPEEIWKECVRFPGREVSNCGNLRSFLVHRKLSGEGGSGFIWVIDRQVPPKIVKLTRDKQGRVRVNLSVNGKAKKMFLHHLVLEAFVGPCPEGKECRHLNDIPNDNRWPDNLCWGTRSENMKDAFRNGGRDHRGEGCLNGKLANADILEIRKRLDDGESQTAIAKYFGVTQSNISRIKTGDCWSHLE